MPAIRIRDAAEILGVSDDTLRRWIDQGKLASRIESGRQVVDGADLAGFATSLADRRAGEPRAGMPATFSNRFRGIVTRLVATDAVVQVEIQAGPHRFVSLQSVDAVQRLGLERGSPAVVTVNAADVEVEPPSARRRVRSVNASDSPG